MGKHSKITSWTPAVIMDKALDREEARMKLATVYVQGQAKRLVNRGNPKGDNPSRPGEPPKKVTGRLFGDIFARVERTKDAVIGYVGTSVAYGRRLELGFVGRDSLGRLYHQLPRPFLRPALFGNVSRVKRILGSK